MKHLFLAFSTLAFSSLYSQQKPILEDQINLMFGVGQILAGGFNVEVNYTHQRLFIDYSHGMNLNSPNSFLEEGTDKEQGLAVHIPWTTGFGVGYRFNNWLNLRAEPKLHKFEIYYDGDVTNSDNRITEYTTFTMGLGLYANLRPFKRSNTLLKGLMITPNIRWWPNVSSSLKGNSYSYFNRRSQSEVTHAARNIGMANTPFFFNVSIGYSFPI